MTRTFCKLIAALSLLLIAAAAHAGSIQFSLSKQTIHFTGIPEALPFGGSADVYSLFATTDGDILSVNNVQIVLDGGASLFHVAPPFGSNVEPPAPEFIVLFPTLSVDSWITTPGPTTLLGADLPGDGTSTWGDLTNDGPQTNFKFAQLTVPPGANGFFSLRISIADPSAPNGIFTRAFMIPEPTAGALAVTGLIALSAVRRRLE